MVSENEKQQSEAFIGGMIVGAVFGIVAAVVGACFHAASMKARCVENGAAHYDSKTGAFTWKNETTASNSATESR